MTAEVVSLPRGGAGARAPLVPPGVDLREDEIFLRLPAWIFDSEWAIECSRDERLAGITLRTRALKQVGNAGSLPASDRLLARLADYGDDVEGWTEVKGRALDGWVLCSDGRWHHPEIARNVLHIWIGRLESRRISAWGNKGRTKEGNARSLDSIMGDMDAALDALAAIDPQDAVLGRGADQQVKWRKRIAETGLAGIEAAPPEIETPYEGPNRPPIRTPSGGGPKVSEAKLSEEDSSSLLCRDDSRINAETDDTEVGNADSSIKRTPAEPARPWPPDYFARFKARFPRKKAWGAAEKALERIHKAGKVPFEDIMAGVERLIAEGRPLEFTKHPASWLNARGWEDEPDPPQGPGGPLHGRSPPRGSQPSILHRASLRAAERMNLCPS